MLRRTVLPRNFFRMDRKVFCAVIILSFWFASSDGGVVNNDIIEENSELRQGFPSQGFPPSGGAIPPGGYPPQGFPPQTFPPMYPMVPIRQCPKCDSSVFTYCSDKLFHDSCCCANPYELPYQCQFADCSFLHANTCREHQLITQCCCTNYLLKK